MVFNNGLQGPPGIPGIKGEVSMPSFINTHIIGVLGCRILKKVIFKSVDIENKSIIDYK